MADFRAMASFTLTPEGVMSHQGWMDDDQFAEDLRIHQEAATNVLDDDFNMQAHTLTLAKAKEEAKALVAELFGSWLQLRHIINQHGTIVQKRWSKKTTEQRKRLLLGVWPQMSESHRPDISFLARCDLSEKGEALADRDAIYFPHINLKDLATSRNFLLFLDSRTRLTPDTFANADMNSLRVGIKCRAIRPGYLGGYTMHLTGQKTPETYGRISSWKEDPESSYKLVSGMGAQPGDGLVILEVQRRIIIFLLACSRSILHDLPSKSLAPPASPTGFTCITLLKDQPDAAQPSLLDMIVESPYGVPDQLDFARLHTYVNAKRSELTDHLWLSREDPAYLVEILREASDHQGETVLEDRSDQNPVTRAISFWERVITGVVYSIYRDVILWDTVWNALQGLEKLRQHYESSILAAQRLPKDYRQALSHFTHLLNEVIEGIKKGLHLTVAGCRPLRHYFIKQVQDPDDPFIRVKARTNVNDHLWWLLEQLQRDDRVEICGLPSLLDEIERLVGRDSKQRERLSPRMARTLSDLAILAELQRQIALSSPGGLIASAVTPPELSSRMVEMMKPVWSVWETTRLDMRVGKFGLDLNLFSYPADKRRNAKTTAEMRSAEKHLDIFWDTVDQHFVKHTGMKLNDGIKNVISDRSLARTPVWREPKQVAASKENDSEKMTTSLLLATLEERTERTERTITSDKIAPIKEKEKTRATNTASLLITKDSCSDDSPSDATIPKSFEVSKRNFRVFSMLFPQPHEEAVQGELPWNDFLHAMTSLGFAVQKLDGSAWLFSPALEPLSRSIIFHEPHPASKIPFRTARRYGGRLARAFGWSAESFVRA